MEHRSLEMGRSAAMAPHGRHRPARTEIEVVRDVSPSSASVFAEAYARPFVLVSI